MKARKKPIEVMAIHYTHNIDVGEFLKLLRTNENEPEVPVCHNEIIPAKYYLDISGPDNDNKIKTITIDVSEETYNQYAIGDTWRSSTNTSKKGNN